MLARSIDNTRISRIRTLRSLCGQRATYNPLSMLEGLDGFVMKPSRKSGTPMFDSWMQMGKGLVEVW